MRFRDVCRLMPLVLATFFFPGALLSASPTRYALAQHKINEARTDIVVYEVGTGRPVWRHKTPAGLDLVSWTPDHRAVAIVESGSFQDPADPARRLLIWEAGRIVRVYTRLQVPARQIRAVGSAMRHSGGDLLAGDSFEQATLSPDKTRLLIRVSSNMAACDWGELWCLTLKSGRFQQVEPEVSEAHWQGSRRIHFSKVRLVLKQKGPNLSELKSTFPQATKTVN